MYMMRHPFDSFGRSYDPFEAMSDLLDLDVPSVQYVRYPRGPARVRQPMYGVRAARSPVYAATRPAMPWDMSMAYGHPTSMSVYPSTVLSYLLEEQRRREELEEAKKRAQLASYLQLLEAALHPLTQADTAAAQAPAIANTAASKKTKTASQRKHRREPHQRTDAQLASSPSQPAASVSTSPTSEVAPTASSETTRDTPVDESATAVAKTTEPVRRDGDDWSLSQDGAAYELRLPLTAGASVANVAMQVLRHPDARRSLQVSVDTEQRQHVRLAGGWPMVSVSRETTSRTVLLPEDASLEGVSVTTQTATSASQLVVRVPRSGEAAATGASTSEPMESATVASDAAVAADDAGVASNNAGSTVAPLTDDVHPSTDDDASQVSSDVTVEDVDEEADEEESATSERR